MIKFEDKFVHFRWSDELKDKKCFVANDMAELRKVFEKGERRTITAEYSEANPFKANGFFPFAYYDPNYDNKVAYEQGKKIQFKNHNEWLDVVGEPSWDDSNNYRVKPESKRMTHRQLAEWLAKGNGQYDFGGTISTDHTYEYGDNRECEDFYKIRRWGSDEWIEPTVYVYAEDCIPEYKKLCGKEKVNG